ncbi:hypothetical protein BO94DRAFT_571035 [Aspergillus sclerotioniger CBS 115572]|uniref:Uncharacterized protein n=1 Tax=Aspergillus sclerotioniger CBS 115572 TaxID=1450535 RepID=A0A317XFX6_9EURO|nr:hypothetical protein BO94DRAFT_571035 [Aspergillus sclerotioniger CBS 115572]PWY96802.1 hypothetical protein BO94DRAFT_571035 [Aspergillus sclerotioniger CBS 115572]
MARRQPKTVDPLSDNSDSSEREHTEDGQYDTDLTEPEDKGSQDRDVSNAALLFADNEHPPEYYIQQLANFDETDYTTEDYGKDTTALLNRVIRQLAKKHKLSTKGRDKPLMDVEDLAKVVETMVSLLRDPQGGPYCIIIEFTFEFTKEWLGVKDVNIYILSEIIFDPSLVLSPYVFLLGLIFADRVFDCVEGISISPDKPLSYVMIEPWVKKIGVIIGFLQVTRLYSLRYGAGTVLDSSGSVSDSLRNLIMHYADICTFLCYYLSRRINKNLPAIIRGLNPEDDIMRAACWMSRSIDPNRLQELITVQSSSVNQDPEIADLIC